MAGRDSELAAAAIAASDIISFVDVSDTTMSAAGSNKRTTAQDLADLTLAQVVVTQQSEKLYSFVGTLAVGAGQARVYFTRPVTISNVYATVVTAPTGASVIIDVNKNGTTIFSTQANRPTITAGNRTDLSAVPNASSVAAGDYLTVDIDQVGSTVAGADLTLGVEYTEVIA